MMKSKLIEAVRNENSEVENASAMHSGIVEATSIVKSEDGRTFVDFYAKSEDGRDTVAPAELTSSEPTLLIERDKKKGGLRELFHFMGGRVSMKSYERRPPTSMHVPLFDCLRM